MHLNRFRKFNETYVGEVVDTNDPERRCRVRVNIFDMTDGIAENELPWANFNLPLGSRPGEGISVPVQVGDKVWIRFVNGDTRRPMIVGSAQAAPEKKVNLPPEQWGGEGQYEHKRTELQPQVEESKDCNVDRTYKENGVLVQVCKNGTFRVTQTESGSAIEVLKSGDMVVHCEGKLFLSVEGDTLEEFNGNVERRIKGNLSDVCEGNISRRVTGNKEEKIDGSASTVASGKYEIRGSLITLN